MARYKPLSEDLHWVIVPMHQKRGASINNIELDTGVNKRTVQRILKLFQITGEVIAKKAEAKRAGKLNADNMDVSHHVRSVFIYLFHIQFVDAVLEHSPDAYLDEIQKELNEACGVQVHIFTVWRALKKRGFTLKKVRT
jgi:transposase